MRLLTRLILSLALSAPLGVQETKATVYIYKNWHQATMGRLAYPVLMNDKEIVKLDRHIYCIVKLDPGEYRFRTKWKEAPPIKLKAEAGRTYYLKVETENGGFMVKDPIISPAREEDATEALKLMEPVKPGDVKDKTIVLTEYPNHPAGLKRQKPPKA